MVFFNRPIWPIFCTIVPETLIFVTVFKQMAFHDYWTDLDDFLCFGKFMVHIFPKSYFRETTPDDLRQPSVESYQIMASSLCRKMEVDNGVQKFYDYGYSNEAITV